MYLQGIFFLGWGGGGGELFLRTGLFLFSDVEHSCLPGSLDDLVRLKSNSIELLQLLEWDGLC